VKSEINITMFSLISVLIDIILLIVVASTVGWVKSDLLQVGLFKYCVDEACGTTLSLFASGASATVSACKASQAFVVLAILLDSLFVAIVLLRIVATSKDYDGIAALMAQIPDATEPVLAASIALSVTIVWTAGLKLRFDICDLVGPEKSCEVHFSFIMAMIVWFSALTVLYGSYQEYSMKQQILRNAANAVQNLAAAAAVPAPGLEQVNVYQGQPGQANLYQGQPGQANLYQGQPGQANLYLGQPGPVHIAPYPGPQPPIYNMAGAAPQVVIAPPVSAWNANQIPPPVPEVR
jgi:hypothetical protein